jgi:hypothetical protein
MTIKSYKLGPGTLKLGPAGATDLSFQVTAMRVRATPTVARTAATPVLAGTEISGNATRSYAWALIGNVLQDIEIAGLVAWTWANKGEPIEFEFIPATDAGVKCTGFLIPEPLDLGGDVGGERPRSDLTWAAGGEVSTDGDDVTGDPVIAAVA